MVVREWVGAPKMTKAELLEFMVDTIMQINAATNALHEARESLSWADKKSILELINEAGWILRHAEDKLNEVVN